MDAMERSSQSSRCVASRVVSDVSKSRRIERNQRIAVHFANMQRHFAMLFCLNHRADRVHPV